MGRRAELAGAGRGRRGRGVDGRDRRRRSGCKASGRLSDAADIGDGFGSPSEIGKLFLTDHLLAFEITSIVLLAAAVGGVVLGSQARDDQPEPPSKVCYKERPGGVMGPDLTWYLAVAAFLFAIGALGVMLRRSPLIVLLSIEIMLNGANLALITFSRHHGADRRPDLRARGDGRGRL